MYSVTCTSSMSVDVVDNVKQIKQHQDLVTA